MGRYCQDLKDSLGLPDLFIGHICIVLTMISKKQTNPVDLQFVCEISHRLQCLLGKREKHL